MINKNKYKQVICTALGWDNFEYQLYQFETGMRYLEHSIKVPDRIKLIAETQSFWMWWTNQWAIRDRNFCVTLGLDMDLAERLLSGIQYDLRELYESEHQPEELKVFPNGSMKRMITAEANQKLKIK